MFFVRNKGNLLDDFLLVKAGVQLWHHHVAVGAGYLPILIFYSIAFTFNAIIKV